MVSTRLVRAVLVALSLSATAQAVVIDAAAGDVALVNRQENSSGGGTTPTATPSATQPTTTTTTQPTTTPTTTTPTTTPTTEPTTTPTTAPTTTPATTTGETTTTTNPTTTPPASTTPGPNTSTGGTTSAPPSSTEVSTTVFTTITSTDANGSPTTHTSGIPTKTTLPLAGNTGNNDEAAQANNKNIIIGVCVGVGGAIVLAVAGVLFWRLRNKRRQEVDHDELQSFGTGYGAPSTAEKTEGSNSTRSPFQSTLESYHAPTQTNTASNF